MGLFKPASDLYNSPSFTKGEYSLCFQLKSPVASSLTEGYNVYLLPVVGVGAWESTCQCCFFSPAKGRYKPS